jgi:hypothetical protein
MTSSGPGPKSLDDAALEATTLALGQTAPDAEPLIVSQCVIQAGVLHLATEADALRLAS